MPKHHLSNDDYWLLLLQLYQKKPMGVKPLYSKGIVDLSLELHIQPEYLHAQMFKLQRITPRIKRLWDKYADNPRLLSHDIKILRSMNGCGNAKDFFAGVEVKESFEKDWEPLAEEPSLNPEKLIIILDCGIKAIEEIAYAKSLGIDFIICDHHMPDEELPPAVAILNPKRPDDTYPFKHLCGCGVGFKLMQAFAKNNGIPFARLIPLLDFCAVSIAADIVPVTEENRILAYHGLKTLNQNPSIGLKAIIDICGLGGRDISMSDIVFKIGPRINASGRMENGRESVDLLVEKDFSHALAKAKHIDEYNEQRKDIDKQMTEEANSIVSKLESQRHRSSIVLYDENWKKGVIGIVASRLTEIYFRPTVVLTRDGDFATGSARSVTGFDVYSAIKSCRDLLVNFGGHTYAAGLTLRWDDIQEFRNRFQRYVDEHIQPEQTEAMLNIDAEIDFRDITKKLHNDLKRFSPFGPGNTKPLFCTTDVYDYGTSKVVGREQEHIKLELVDSKSSNIVNGIAFGQSASARYIKSKRSFDIAYTIEDNVFKRNMVQLQIEDIRVAEED